MLVEKRYTALRVIATILKAFGWVTLVSGIAAAIGLYRTGGHLVVPAPLTLHSLPGAALTLGVGIVYFILFYALAESILVFLDIEENTRLTARYLSERR